MVAFVQKSSSIGNFGGSNTCTPGSISAATANNLIIFPYCQQQTDSVSSTQAATGYTATNSKSNSTVSNCGCFYKVAAGGETTASITNTTGGLAANSFGDGILAEFSGLATSSPYVSADSNTAGATATTLAISSSNPLSEASGLAVVVYGGNGGVGFSGKTWPPASWTSLDTDGNGNTVLMAYFIFSSTAQLTTGLGTVTSQAIIGSLTIFKVVTASKKLLLLGS